jgi:hypothetical protein
MRLPLDTVRRCVSLVIMKRFSKREWKVMRVITAADERLAQVRADSDGDMWIWVRANGHHVWANAFTDYPYRNDLHRLMNTIAKPDGWPDVK